ncbi:MAG: TetR/AcrR family transcriptional regulator [Canibacter sp.]
MPIRRRPVRTEQTKAKLFRAAMEIMSQKGPTATTVDEVAAKAGVAKGSVYYNFGSKRSMVDSLLRYGVDQMLDRVDQLTDDIPVHDLIVRSVRAALEFLEETPGFARLALAEMWRPSTGASPIMVEQRGRLLARLTELTTALIAEHEPASNPDAESLAVALFGATFMLTMERELDRSPRSLDMSMSAIEALLESFA